MYFCIHCNVLSIGLVGKRFMRKGLYTAIHPLRSNPFMRTTHNTRLVGILCHPVAEELIHEIFSWGVEITDADAACLQFDAQAKDMRGVIAGLHALKATGVYLTGRLRTSAAGIADYLSDEAHGTGVINTITFDQDRTTGHNTEAGAIISVLEPYQHIFARGSAVVLGGGAMARSVLYALVRHFRMKNIAIADRTLQQAQLLRQVFSEMANPSARIEAHELFPPDIAQLLAEARLIVNTTPIGTITSIDQSPITVPDIFHNRQLVMDVNFGPAITRMLAEAADSGATIISGAEVLIRQVAQSYELLTHSQFPAERIRTMLAAHE